MCFKRPQKTVRGEIFKKSERKFQLKNIFNAWTNHFSKIPSKQLGEQTRLHVDAERELWSVRKVVVHTLIFFLNYSSNSFLRSLVEEAILICLIAAAFLHRSKSCVFFSFAAITSLNTSLTNSFSLSHIEFRETFAHFRYHGTLFFMPVRVTSHLASSSSRYFGTRSLKREN